jgi:hypothetical protein
VAAAWCATRWDRLDAPLIERNHEAHGDRRRPKPSSHSAENGLFREAFIRGTSFWSHSDWYGHHPVCPWIGAGLCGTALFQAPPLQAAISLVVMVSLSFD